MPPLTKVAVVAVEFFATLFAHCDRSTFRCRLAFVVDLVAAGAISAAKKPHVRVQLSLNKTIRRNHCVALFRTDNSRSIKEMLNMLTYYYDVAERVGFEPTEPEGSAVFKTAGINQLAHLSELFMHEIHSPTIKCTTN